MLRRASSSVLLGTFLHSQIWQNYTNPLKSFTGYLLSNVPFSKNTNLLLTEREGRTGEYWPEVVAVQYCHDLRPIFPSTAWASSVSKLFINMALCDTCFNFIIKSFQIFRMIKLAWTMFVVFIHLWNVGKISIFVASSGSFTVKNDNIHSLFFAVLVPNFEFPGFAPKYTGLDRFHGNGPYCKILTEKEPIRAQGLGLPYNNNYYYIISCTNNNYCSSLIGSCWRNNGKDFQTSRLESSLLFS
mgnify:CR=1 FL=1